MLCTICGPNSYDYASKQSLSNHMRSSHFEGVLLCQHCGDQSLSYKNPTTLEHHIRTDHPDERKCKICGPDSLVFSSKNTLFGHIRDTHSTGPRVQCPICGRSLSCKKYMKEHIQRRVCTEPRQRFQASLMPITATGGAIPQPQEDLQSYNVPDNNGFASSGASQVYDEEVPMTDEEFEAVMQSYLHPEIDVPIPDGTIGMGQTDIAVAPMTHAEYQAYLNSFDFDALHQLDSNEGHGSEPSMSDEEYQNYLLSIGL